MFELGRHMGLPLRTINTMSSSSNATTLHLYIRDRTKVISNTDVRMISGVNEKGNFDILPLHSNFISLIEQRIVMVRMDGTKEEIVVNNGILRCIENRVEIYIGVHV